MFCVTSCGSVATLYLQEHAQPLFYTAPPRKRPRLDEQEAAGWQSSTSGSAPQAPALGDGSMDGRQAPLQIGAPDGRQDSTSSNGLHGRHATPPYGIAGGRAVAAQHESPQGGNNIQQQAGGTWGGTPTSGTAVELRQPDPLDWEFDYEDFEAIMPTQVVEAAEGGSPAVPAQQPPLYDASNGAGTTAAAAGNGVAYAGSGSASAGGAVGSGVATAAGSPFASPPAFRPPPPLPLSFQPLPKQQNTVASPCGKPKPAPAAQAAPSPSHLRSSDPAPAGGGQQQQGASPYTVRSPVFAVSTVTGASSRLAAGAAGSSASHAEQGRIPPSSAQIDGGARGSGTPASTLHCSLEARFEGTAAGQSPAATFVPCEHSAPSTSAPPPAVPAPPSPSQQGMAQQQQPLHSSPRAASHAGAPPPLLQPPSVPLAAAGPEDPELTLTAEQQRAVDAAAEGRNVFFTGSAGTGKSAVQVGVVALMHRSAEHV